MTEPEIHHDAASEQVWRLAMRRELIAGASTEAAMSASWAHVASPEGQAEADEVRTIQAEAAARAASEAPDTEAPRVAPTGRTGVARRKPHRSKRKRR